MTHFIHRCRGCQTVVAQCRCPGPKPTFWVTCDECKKAGKADLEYDLTHIPEAYRANVAALAEMLVAFETRDDGQKVDNWKIDNPMCLKQAGFTWEASRSVAKNNRVVIAVKIFTQGHGEFSFDIRH